MTDVSVVVPVLNAEATLAATLAALGAQDIGHELIVVDCGSSDGTLALLDASEAIVLHHRERDPAGARNLGVAHARGDVLAFTDADCAPDPGWLAAGVRALAGAELVQGRVIPAREAGVFDRTVSVGGEHGLYETANVFVTRDAFTRAGGFERVPGLTLPPGVHFGEDTWFAWRCRRSGARTAFAADAIVRHAVFPRTASDFVAERTRARLFPGLIAAVPELRDAFLHRRWFLSPATLRFDLALAGAAAGLAGRRAAWLLAAPWLAAVARAPSPCVKAAADAVTAAALASGSLRHRCAVL